MAPDDAIEGNIVSTVSYVAIEVRGPCSGSARVPLGLLSLAPRPYVRLNRGRLRLLELPPGDVVDRA